MFSFIAIPLGYVMEFIYNFCQNYGAALIIFTVIIKVVMFPLAIKQQKSTAKMSAYQPMINEISKKYAKDKVKQQEEMVRLQQEYGFSPTAGCLPMGLNFLLLFGIIDVVYKPLTYILHVSNDAVLALQTAANIATTEGFRVESTIISAVQTHPHIFNGIVDADILDKIRSFNFMFCGIDLSQIPTVGFNILVIIPVLSVITMILSQIVMTKASGQEMQGSMKYMPWVMSLMFVYFCF
ncbi:MAG: YidC/Oxa1 family membrane protein insertase, partial [Pygmaiobacter sp.]